MLFMVVEHFKNCDAKAIYRRLRDSGRQMPEGLKYIESWVEPNFDRCFQLMETSDLRLLQSWILCWTDLMDFEIVPVVPSKDTRETVEAACPANPRSDSPVRSRPALPTGS
jgi:hypothetical protein